MPFAQAAGVVDVAPANLRDYLRTHPQVVVEYNSPDTRCGFCGKSVDAAFQTFSNRFGSDISFVRVQWTPWASIPPEISALGVGGVPMHQVFKAGTSVNELYGRLDKPEEYAATVKALFPGAVSAPIAALPPSAPSISPARPLPTAPTTPVIVASPAASDFNPLAECPPTSPSAPSAEIPWNVNGADFTACFQTAVGAYPADFSKGVAAFRRRELVALRDDRTPPVHDTWGVGTQANNKLVASGYAESPGELWWGLFDQRGSGRRHIAVGQETFTRLMASLMRTNSYRAAELALGRMPVPYPGTPEAAYVFADATPVTSRGYLGGNGSVADGRITRADLNLGTLDPIHGELRIEFEIEGVAHSLTIPLKRNVLETQSNQVLRGAQMNQLVSGRASGATVVDCVAGPTSISRSPCSFHLDGSSPKLLARYQAAGFFFGPQSDFLVVSYTFNDLDWTGQNGSRSFGISDGLIVLRAR